MITSFVRTMVCDLKVATTVQTSNSYSIRLSFSGW